MKTKNIRLQNKVKLITILLLVLTFSVSAFLSLQHSVETYATTASGEPNLQSAKSAILIESSTGRVLLSHNMNQQLPMASTTKIVTALTVIANCDNLDEEVKIDDRAVGVEGSSIYLTYGEVLTVRQLLYGLMLRSGNDSAVALAIHVGGSVEGFAKLMNEQAEKLSLTNTHFDNPNGLPCDTHYTSAYDLAMLTAEAYKYKDFAQIVGTKKYSFTSPSGKQYYFDNENKLLNQMENADGVKTGYTKKAGRCFVGSAKFDDMRLIAVVLNCGPMFEVCHSMLEYGNLHYTMANIVPYNKVCGVTFFNKQCQKYVSPTAFSYPIKKSSDELQRINKIIELPQNIDDSAKISIYLDKQLIFSQKLVTI